MTRRLTAWAACILLVLAGCETLTGGRDPVSEPAEAPSVEEAPPEILEPETSNSEEAEQSEAPPPAEEEGDGEEQGIPPDAFDGVDRVAEDYWEVIAAPWALLPASDPTLQDRFNYTTVESFPTELEPPYVVGENGERLEIPDTIVQIDTNPATGRQIQSTTTYTGQTKKTLERFDYQVTFEGEVLYEETDLYPGPGSPGQGFWWGDEEIIVSGYFQPFYLYNVNERMYLPLTYPLSEWSSERAGGPSWSRENLIHTACTYLHTDAQAYIATYIDGNELEDESYARDYGAGRQTLYYLNWETGQTFAFYENDYRPQGAGRPEYLNIRYVFDEDGNFVFVVDNRYDLANLGDEVGQAIYAVDVDAQSTSLVMEVPFGVMDAGCSGDYVAFITSFYSNSAPYAYLYDYRQEAIARECRGEIHGFYAWKYPVILDRDANAVCVFDTTDRREYRLDLQELEELLPDYSIGYNVNDLLIAAGDALYRPDYGQILGLVPAGD